MVVVVGIRLLLLLEGPRLIPSESQYIETFPRYPSTFTAKLRKTNQPGVTAEVWASPITLDGILGPKPDSKSTVFLFNTQTILNKYENRYHKFIYTLHAAI